MLEASDGVERIHYGDLPECDGCGHDTPAEFTFRERALCGGCLRQALTERRADTRSARKRYGRAARV